MDVLWRKAPREKKVCHKCGGGFGLVRPNYPYCSPKCKQEVEKPPDQYELPLQKPPDTTPSNR